MKLSFVEHTVLFLTACTKAVWKRLYNPQRIFTHLAYKLCNCQPNVLINGSFIGMSKNVQVHSGTRINKNFEITGSGKVTIGHHTHIGPNVTIITTNHNFESEISIPYDYKKVTKPVVIGECTWIGRDVIIMPGVTIGMGSIISAGTVVSKDVKPGEIVGSNSQKVIKMRDMEMFISLYNQGSFK